MKTILEATSQVLVQRGYDKTTTGAVVERAGVSIGTLYQYFPNKESLVASLIEEHVREVLVTVESALQLHVDSPLHILLRAIVRSSLDAHKLQPELHKVLVEQVPRVGKLAKAMDLSQRLSKMVESHLTRHLGHLSAARIRLIAFVLETTIEALTHRAVIESPSWLRTGVLEDEALALLEPYLKKASSAGA